MCASGTAAHHAHHNTVDKPYSFKQTQRSATVITPLADHITRHKLGLAMTSLHTQATALSSDCQPHTPLLIANATPSTHLPSHTKYLSEDHLRLSWVASGRQGPHLSTNMLHTPCTSTLALAGGTSTLALAGGTSTLAQAHSATDTSTLTPLHQHPWGLAN
jgi:hypothetical protein